MQKIILLFVLLCLTLPMHAQNVTVSGALVGNGSYPTLTAAFAAINGGAQTSAAITVSVLAHTNEGSGTAVLNAGTWTSITVVPVGSPRSITGATAPGQPLIDLNGADRVTFNGQLPGGVRGLTFENTTVANSTGTGTVRFRSDATLNTITRCKVFGGSTGSGATIYFAAGQVTVGNDNNTISLCDIGPSGANLPRTAIFSLGDPNSANSNNLVTQCNIYDYFQCGTSSTGISLGEGNLTWTISQCRFYQTAPRVCSLFVWHRGILINAGQGNADHTINANTFGYANSLGTGKSVFASSSNTITGNFYRAIDVPSMSHPGFVTVTNNVVAGFDFPNMNGNDQVFSFAGIKATGSINVDGNTIGSSTVPGTISMGSLGGTGNVIGIDLEITGVKSIGATVNNNTVGGFDLDVPSTTSLSFSGIKTYGNQPIFWCTMTNNRVGFAAAPIVVNSASTLSLVRGIEMYGYDMDVFDNRVCYLFSRSVYSEGLVGLDIRANGLGNLLYRNVVFALENTQPIGITRVIGILAFDMEFTDRNHVHSLSAVSANGNVLGMYVRSFDPCLHSNNMIRLGRNYQGQSIQNGIKIFGIYDYLGTSNFNFNSVYIGGDNVGGSASTYAYYGDVIQSNVYVSNNIFYNARSNGSGTGSHYAFYVAGPVIPSRFHNDLYVSGNGGILGFAMGQNVLTLPAWQTLTAGDVGSISSDPKFIHPDGDAISGDLHIGPNSPIEAAGSGVAFNGNLARDFDNQIRSSLTPTDIGADAAVIQGEAPEFPEIVLTGNGQLIADGDTVVSAADGTNFGAGFCEALPPRVFVLQNTGTAPLLISSYGFTGPGAAQFSVVVPPPGVIAPGQSATFTLALTASVTGPASAQFNLSCNDWDETFYNFAVQGSSLGDTAAPVAVCQALNLYVGSGGSVTASPPALAAGSTDNCGIASFTASPSTFTCNQLGPQAVLVQVTDYAGQSDACSTTVMVLDTTRPSVTCSAPILLLNASGQAVLTATAMNNNSTDNCAIDSLWASATQFDCSDIGPNAVTLSVRDASGNVGTCTAQVTVLDLMAPTVVCQPVALLLDPSGQASLSPTAVELSSSDNCGVVGRSLSISQFTCAQVGSNSVTLTVVDAAGNAGTCQAQISVSETLPPAITCTSANLYLNASGQATLPPSAVASATDNCGSVALTLSQSQFTCAEVGPQVLLAAALDPSSNGATCTAYIQVLDTLSPVLTCQNTSVSVGTSGSTPLTLAAVLASSSDNCGIDTLFLSRMSVSCADAGVVPVLVSAVDIHGNLATCTAQVTVQAVALAASLVQPATNACGYQIPCAGMTVDSVPALATGGCAPYTYAWSNGQAGAVATGLGAGTHSVTVTDGAGATVVQSIQLTEPTALTASLVVAQVPCGQDSTGVLSVSGSGGNACQPSTYLWSNGGTGASVAGLVAGTYQVTVTDVAGCMDSASVVLPALQVPQPVVSQSQDTLFAGPAFFSYQWSLNGQPIVGATAFFHVPAADGLYTVTVTDSNGCAGTSPGYPYTAVAYQPGLSASLGLQVFPNPNDGRFVLLGTRVIDLPVRLTLIDLSGPELATWDFPGLATRSALEARGLAAGSYLLRVDVADGSRQVLRVVVQ